MDGGPLMLRRLKFGQPVCLPAKSGVKVLIVNRAVVQR